MKDETFEKLFEFSHNREDNLLTPLILEYYTLESYGLDEEKVVRIMEDKYK